MITLPDWVASSLLTLVVTILWYKRKNIPHWFGI